MPDTNDLWPENIADSNLVTPVSILKQQAALLGEKTRQLVKGEVVTQTTGNLFVHRSHAQLQIRIVHPIPRRQLLPLWL